MNVDAIVNGTAVHWDVEPRELLLDTLRRHGLTGAKRVCESGECGACAVIVDGRAVDSCLLLTAQADGTQITSVEGIEAVDGLHPVQQAFRSNGAVQCGFCIPGMVVTATSFLAENSSPTEEEVRHAFVGNLCRCTGYKKPIEAVLNAARAMEGRDED
jgi:carbon-monoxide dehydrogenase small subunit